MKKDTKPQTNKCSEIPLGSEIPLDTTLPKPCAKTIKNPERHKQPIKVSPTVKSQTHTVSATPPYLLAKSKTLLKQNFNIPA